MHDQKNTDLLQQIYVNFSKSDIPAVLAACDDKIKFEISGQSVLSGKFTKENFSTYISKMHELSAGTLKTELHELFASDRHGIVLGTNTLIRDGKKIEYRTVHVWRFDAGKPVAFYEYARDLYQFDNIWKSV